MTQHGPQPALPTPLTVLLLSLALGGCFKTTNLTILQTQDGGGPPIGSGPGAPKAGAGASAASGVADGGGEGTTQNASAHAACSRGGLCQAVLINNVDKVDLLFVVDDTPSMIDEQAALKEQLPKLIATLVTGMRVQPSGGADPNPFPPVKDLHLGVVSTNMGVVGIQGIPGCSGVTGVTSMVPGFGDDGILRTVPPSDSTCTANFPAGQRFLSYTMGGPVSTMQLAADFSCVAVTGTKGCGFEQQLESPLKALWPSVDIDVKTGKTVNTNRITFLTDTAHQMLQYGHGDLENHGFVRNSMTEGLSLLAVLLLTEEEDCSSKTTVHFTPQAYLQRSDPLYSQDLNLRCFYNQKSLYPTDRYVNALKALRAGNEDLVVFGAIAGVPADLADDAAYAATNWTNESSRNAFYNHVLQDPRMIQKPDPSKPAGEGSLIPSCVTATSTATPPRRIVQVAQGFGENGMVRSICELNQFPPAIDAFINVIAKRLGAVCLPQPLVRKADGTVPCDMVWEMSAPGGVAPAPTDCTLPFLKRPPADHKQIGDNGGQLCTVQQLPVSSQTTPAGGVEGWYYDDFSAEAQKTCTHGAQRIAYSANAKPPQGVATYLDCDPSAQP